MRNEAGLEWGGGGTGQMRYFKPPAVTFPGGTGFIRGPRVSRTAFCAY